MNESALFIPLNKKHYEAFERGDKTHEYRLAGGRWNERTCKPGRAVILSCGYGKKRRLIGEILNFSISSIPCGTQDWYEIYGDKKPAACIQIEVMGKA